MWARLSLRGEGWGEGELDSRHFHELRSCEPNSPLPYRLPNLPVVGLFGSSACRVRSRPARLPSANRKPGLYYEARRRLEWPKVIPRESPMYARRLSHDSPIRLPGADNRFGLCNWASSAPLIGRRPCRPELRIEGRLCNKPDGMRAVARRSGVGPGAVPRGSRKALIARYLRR